MIGWYAFWLCYGWAYASFVVIGLRQMVRPSQRATWFVISIFWPVLILIDTGKRPMDEDAHEIGDRSHVE